MRVSYKKSKVYSQLSESVRKLGAEIELAKSQEALVKLRSKIYELSAMGILRKVERGYLNFTYRTQNIKLFK